MTYKIKEVDGKSEKEILIGMIVSSSFLRQIQPIFDPDLLKNSFIRTASSWCLRFYDKYKEAPKKQFQSLFESYCKKHKDSENIELMGEFLDTLSDEWEDSRNFNWDFLLEQTKDYFREVSLEYLSEDISECLVEGDLDQADELVDSYSQVSIPLTQGIDVFRTEEALEEAFKSAKKPLFRVKGALGQLINNQLVREGFIAIQAPEKATKTWWLNEFAIRAYQQKCNVAVFQLGDLSQSDFLQRVAIRQAKRPIEKEYAGNVLVPVLDCKKNQTGTCSKTCKLKVASPDGSVCEYSEAPKNYKACSRCQSTDKYIPALWQKQIEIPDTLKLDRAKRIFQHVAGMTKGKELKLAVYPSRTTSIHDIDCQLELWKEREGFVPDLVVIDHMDILDKEPGSHKDYRHQVFQNWSSARSLSQKWKCLLLTATWSSSISYDQKTQTRQSFSEDKRKYGHITGMLGLNQTEEEGETGLCRVSWVVLRRGHYKPYHQVGVTQCLSIGRVMLDSFWLPKEQKKE